MKKFEFFMKDDQVLQSDPVCGSNLKLEEISPDQMYSIKGILLLSVNVKKVEKNTLKKEKIVVKIINNIIVDEYRIFNKLIYNFQIKDFNERNYFVSIGGDFDLHNIQGEQQYMMISSIKFFDATTIIPTTYPLKKPDMIWEKNICVKKISLLHAMQTNSIFLCKENKPIPKEVESFQNILSFAINDEFTMCAVGLDKGRIILIIGRPNILECPDDKFQIRFLTQIEEELHITNLAFSYVDYQGSKIDILYATTTKDIYYYIFPTDTKEEIQQLNQDGIEMGAYSGCIAVNGNRLLVGTNSETCLIEYDNLERGPSWFFEGRKYFVSYFKNYIVFITCENKSYSINIYDRDNRFLAYNNQNFYRITGLCSDEDNIYVFVENEKPEISKYVLSLKEKDNKDKFTTFYAKNFYDTAVEYAKSLKYDKQKISEISKKYAEHLYSKGEYKSSIEQFILTINYLDPSYVIQKFLEKKKLAYLITYLEALDKDETFKTRDPDEIKDYTALLLNCYIMEEKTASLNAFLKDRNNSFQLVDIQTVIDICSDTNQFNLALSIAEKTHKMDGYLDILINKNKQKKTALEKIENETSLQVKFDLLCKYGKDLTSEKTELKNALQALISSIKSYRDNGKDVSNIKYEELIKIFLDKEDEQQLSELLTFIIEKDDKCPGTIIHKQIEIYLDKLFDNKKAEDEKEIKKQILKLLKDYKDRINLSYVYILFSSKELEDKDNRLKKVIEERNAKIDELNKPGEMIAEEEKKNKAKIEPAKEEIEKKEAEKTKKKKEIREMYERLFKAEEIKSHFPEGMIYVLEMMEQRQKLLFIYIETQDFEAILKECEALGQKTENKAEFETYIIWSLNGLVDKIVDQVTYDQVFPYVLRMLDKIIDNNLPLLQVLKILKRNKMMKFASIKGFMKKAIEKENALITESRTQFEEKWSKVESVKSEIKDIKIKCVTFKPNKCAICTRQISLPAVYFFCQHGYDLGCMNRDTINDMKATGCGKCLNQNIIDNNRSIENLEASKNYAKFQDSLAKQPKKFEYTMSMLKEGIMVLGKQHY